MPYRKFLESNNIPVNELELNRLEALDRLCDKCKLLPGDQFMCEGLRVYLDTDVSKFYSRMHLTSTVCDKKLAAMKEERLLGRITKSGVPESVSRKIVKEEAEFSMEYISSLIQNGSARIPTNDETVERSWRLVCNTLTSTPYTARWVWPKALYSKDYKVDPEFWKGLYNKYTTGTELLIVHRADMHLGSDFKKEIIMKIFEHRIMYKMFTLFSIGSNPQADTDMDEYVYDSIQKLPGIEL